MNRTTLRGRPILLINPMITDRIGNGWQIKRQIKREVQPKKKSRCYESRNFLVPKRQKHLHICSLGWLFASFFSEPKWFCFGFDVNYLHSEGYYPIRRTLVTTMSTRCTKGKQSRKNMFFKYQKDNRQQDQK